MLNKEGIIGDNVLIMAHVTIGKKSKDSEAMVIGNNVGIGVAENTVVLKDVPACMIAVGVPTKLIIRKYVTHD